jgi:hypothetical protein
MTSGPDLLTEAEEIIYRIQFNLKAAKSHQENYANKRCHPLTFTVGAMCIYVSHPCEV